MIVFPVNNYRLIACNPQYVCASKIQFASYVLLMEEGDLYSAHNGDICIIIAVKKLKNVQCRNNSTTFVLIMV